MTVKGLLIDILWLYWLVLMARLVLSYVVMLARDWRPRGVVLLLVEGVYTLTDPPIKALRRVIPPLRIGGVALDLAFMALLVIVLVLMQIIARV
ncbi:YggT family protein [Arsenicicoccus sp. oral taxon 190]|uniref:YggT family protein n=1 Tax=Arsenicicoccus sp. oral taxon 190 TaxID=1658671 RepID=UPI00067A1590|nr:YggT family protein [Arsenicicoccus sp. oral taxon 190]AKT51644.1 membrane protein [Arsenicicoccus sp. oral taxon 190]